MLTFAGSEHDSSSRNEQRKVRADGIDLNEASERNPLLPGSSIDADDLRYWAGPTFWKQAFPI